MSDNDGHNYTWSPPTGGWVAFDSEGKVVRAQSPDLNEFLYEDPESDPDERVWRYLDWLMPDEDTIADDAHEAAERG